MTKLNCGVGDLAITVTCNYPENLGKIVQIFKPVGFKAWAGIEGQVFTWEVVVAGEKSWLLYEIDCCPVTMKVGYVPDLYLRRITPPKNTRNNNKNNKADNLLQGILDFTAIDQEEAHQIKDYNEDKKTKDKESEINLHLAHDLT